MFRQRLLDEGRYGSITELAAAERIERGYLGRVLQLTLLPPRVVEAIVDGRQGADVTLPGLMGGVAAVWSVTDDRLCVAAQRQQPAT